MVTPAFRAQLHRALPTSKVTDARADLDGATGTALGLRVGVDFEEIIVNPADSAFIGWRESVRSDHVA